jgi:hypothetical protein
MGRCHDCATPIGDPCAFDSPGLTPGANEVQRISIVSAVNGALRVVVRFNGVDSGDIRMDANAASIQATLEAMSSIGTGNVLVTGGPLISALQADVEFRGALANTNFSQMTFTNVSPGITTPLVTTITNGAAGSGTEDPLCIFRRREDAIFAVEPTVDRYWRRIAASGNRNWDGTRVPGLIQVGPLAPVNSPYTLGGPTDLFEIEPPAGPELASPEALNDAHFAIINCPARVEIPKEERKGCGCSFRCMAGRTLPHTTLVTLSDCMSCHAQGGIPESWPPEDANGRHDPSQS